MSTSPTPLGALARGALAGAVGTAAMDAVGYLRHRRGGGTQAPLDWELSLHVERWEDAPAPAQLGRRLAEAFTGRPVPVEKAALVNNVMHWGYGIAWGAQFGAAALSVRGASRLLRAALGLPFGAVVWGSSYVTLPLAGLYKPIWEYHLPTLARDLGAHLAYGLGSGATLALTAPG
jgi:hypothetical protein